MPRTIKVRVWSTKDKKMCEPFEMDWLKHGIGPEDWKNGFLKGWWFSEDDVFLEWTGLLDKEGKEIYEGDIVTNGGISAEVIYTLGNTGFELKTKKGQFIGSPTGWENIEIIGNIYENPALVNLSTV